MKAYSLDDEDYFTEFSELVEEALENDFAAGSTYYERDCKPLEVKDVFNVWRFIDQLDEAFYEEVGEAYSEYVTSKATEELNDLICDWINKNLNPSKYYKLVGEKREVAFTEEDLQE